MVWDIAAGVIIGGFVLALTKLINKPGWNEHDSEERNLRYAVGRTVVNVVLGAVGVALAIWIVLFKANYRH
jgi:hypothetical protein